MRYFSIAFLILLIAAEISLAQDRSKLFREDLHARGIQLLKELDQRDRSEVAYIAFQSAATLNPDELLGQVIDLTNMTPRVVLQNAMHQIAYFEDLNLALQQLDKFQLAPNDKYLLPRIAFHLGAKGQNIDRLLKQTERYLRDLAPNQETEREEIDPQTIYEDRVEELSWLYHLGNLRHQPLGDSFAVPNSIQTPPLRDGLRIQWLKRAVITREHETKIKSVLGQFESDFWARDSLIASIADLDAGRLQSTWGNQLVSFAIERHASILRAKGAAKFHESYEYEFRDVRIELDAANRAFPFFDEQKLRELYENSRLAARDPDLKKQNGYGFLEPDHEHSGNTKPFPDHLSLIVGGGQRVEPPDGVDRTPISGTFAENLASSPKNKRATWIINFVVRTSWQEDRFVDVDAFPESNEILNSFKLCDLDNPKLAKLIAKSFRLRGNSAANDLLIQMMNSLPEATRIVTQSEVESKAHQIRNDEKIDMREALIQSMSLVRRSKNSDRWQAATKLAFEFAFRGDEHAVNMLLNEVDNNKEKAWACFQCSAVFPPRRFPNGDYWYSCSRGLGGAF